MLEKMGLKAPTHVKTGTTIAGIIFKVLCVKHDDVFYLATCVMCFLTCSSQDGVVLGADTRATAVCVEPRECDVH